VVLEKFKLIRLIIPYTDEREIEEIGKVLASGYLTQGSKTAEFENKVANFVGSQNAFAMSSCTTALHMALVVLDIGEKDEVIVPDFTFPATANVVIQQGATPVLVDIDLDTFTVSIESLKEKITNRTKAIIPVHAFGCSADMDPIINLANYHGIAIIEDAACALGSSYYDQNCGNIGTMGCFSFHPRKVITTGEGGMITTNDHRLAERIQLLRSHGGKRVGFSYEYTAAGFNYRLSDVHSALGVAQMEKLPWIIDRKRTLAKSLTARLMNIPGIRLPIEPKWGGHIYQSYIILVDEYINRDQIVKDMKAHGIETTLGTYALHDQPIFQRQFGYISGQLPNSHTAFTHSVTLPLYPQMDETALDQITNTLRIVIQEQAG
jgi:perosamine synthetase